MEANADPAANSTIHVPAGTYNLTLERCNSDEECGDLDLLADMEIRGSTSGFTVVDGSDLNRVFDIYSPNANEEVSVLLKNVTIRDGNTPAEGGGIRNGQTANLELDSVTLNSNEAHDGGAIHNRGEMILVNVTLYNNEASHDGGAVHHGSVGGNSGSSADFSHVTISNSSAGNDGDGIFYGPFSASFFVRYSILSSGENCSGVAFASAGKNLFSDDTCSYIVGVDSVNTSPMLGAFQDNGGTTNTRVPNAGSPALDQFPNCAFEVDQRGVPRPQNDSCDLGAVEVGRCQGARETRVGNAGSNTLTGGAGVDVILGLGGSDTIRGAGANDKLCGNNGNDTIDGDGGSDKINGGSGTDGCNGDAGADQISNCESGVP